ncbi:radical SAM protein [Helicobacter sp. MIT 11-5569]|uniref:radical SAM protein n=1 Tax=Helicobacter sp. MIT 11-5569 TaxID=1548151 RepID=UPI00054EAE09|nr:radical SAM protein [Helicobacter sp. MIT 11-5569]TLD84584.1 radical SAM protein [Helicobacter sp. MIT 11-5569]
MIEKIALYLVGHIKPRVVYLQITTKCNYVCPMCPFHGSGYEGKYFKDNPSLKPQNMPLDEAKKCIDKIVDYGANMVAMSPSAEFFIYPYWEEISRYIKQKGLKISATTNGSFVTKEVIAKLKDIGFDELIFSIDSINQETYAKVRSSKEKDYQTAISAPILATEAGIYVQVHFTQQKPNRGEKDAVFSFYKMQNIRSMTFGIELHTEENKELTIMPIERKEYIHGLCGAYNNLVILIDGNLVSCCGFANRYKYIKPKLDAFSLREHSICEVLSYQHSLMANKDEDVMKLCCSCDLYQIAFESKNQISVENNYVIIKKTISESHFRIPKELENIPNNILSWMYQNNIVSKMKQDKIL